jgi:SAM-dependent methyltransferase
MIRIRVTAMLRSTAAPGRLALDAVSALRKNVRDKVPGEGSDMAQNIYDEPTFFAGYSQLKRQQYGLDGAPEWPAMRAALPDLQGAGVLDLGCGFGWFARWARENGAAHVLGIDLSRNMIERAKADTDDPAIAYRIADMEQLDLRSAEFDVAYSSLAFHYVQDFSRLAALLHRTLRAGGRLVFSIEHPIFMAPRQPGWATSEDGHRTWPIDHYSVEGKRTTDWFAKCVVKYHRRLGTTLNALIGAGFAIKHVDEWAPTATQLAAIPTLADEVERPMLVIIAADRL